MLRILIMAGLAYLLYQLFKTVFKSNREIEPRENGGVIDEMVQDPVCKTYIPRREAVRKRIDGKDIFFCSKACASKYQSRKEE